MPGARSRAPVRPRTASVRETRAQVNQGKSGGLPLSGREAPPLEGARGSSPFQSGGSISLVSRISFLSSCWRSAAVERADRLGVPLVVLLVQRVLPFLPFCTFAASLSSRRASEESPVARLRSARPRLDLVLLVEVGCAILGLDAARVDPSFGSHFDRMRAMAPLSDLERVRQHVEGALAASST